MANSNLEDAIDKNLRIFVIDADKYLVNIMRNVLLSIGISHVDSAQDGKVAMARIEQDGTDIVICDYDIGPAGGLYFCKKLRQHEDIKIRELPIIMISNKSILKQVFQARDTGINEFLIKPISSKSLSSRLSSVLLFPRRFVDAENFQGPDRRRRDERRLEEGALYQGDKRSEGERRLDEEKEEKMVEESKKP